MHRSGTSATTALLGKLGVGMPATRMEINEGNPKGYWESVRLHDIHEQLLRDAGSRWNDWAPLQVAADGDRTDQLLAVLAEEFDLGRINAVKDPRMCRMVPFWLNAAAKAGLSPRIVIPYRNPVEVAASLVQRGGGMTAEQGLLLWLRHVLDAEVHTRGLRRVFLRYDRLIADWRATVARMTRAFEVQWPIAPADAADEIEQFLDVRLRRQIAADSEIARLHPWFAGAYRAFDALSDDRQDSAGAEAELDRIRADFDGLHIRRAGTPEAISQRDAAPRADVDAVR